MVAQPMAHMDLRCGGPWQIGPWKAPAVEAEMRDDFLRARCAATGQRLRRGFHDIGASPGDEPARGVHVARARDAQPELQQRRKR